MFLWHCTHSHTSLLDDLSARAKARAFRPDDKELEDDTHNAIKSLGVNRIFEDLSRISG